MAVLTINQYIDTISSFVNNVKNSKNSYYLFYGKTDSWLNLNGNVDDTSVSSANSSVYSYEQSIYKDLVFGKLITSNDITYMIPRYNWTSNTVYYAYSQIDSNLYDNQFYVITDAYEVYKCIDNNNGSPSTVKPSLTTTTGVFSTADNYVWKYMFTVESNANTKFTSSTYIPVTPNNDVTNNAVKGSIDFIRVSNSGINYQAYDSGYLQNFQNNYVVQIANTASPITGRYVNSAIYLKTGYGGGQIRNIINYSGLNRLVTVSQPFDTSVILNIENINGAFNVGTLASQRIDNISFLYQQGYLNISDQIVQSDTGAAGSIISANVTLLKVVKSSSNDFVQNLPFFNTAQSGVLRSGEVDIKTNILRTLNISFPGSGYTANATVTIANSVNDTTGSGATANSTANLSGRISTINITNQGAGYTLAPTVTVAPPSPIYFNANTNIDVGNNFIILTGYGNYFANGDYVLYQTSSGNTVLTNLANNNYYYVIGANSTGFKLSTSISNSTPISLVKGKTESGHSFTGQSATVNSSIDTYYITSNSGTSFTTDFAVGEYIRVGNNSNVNVRYITAVNSSVITVNYPLTTNAIANSVYQIVYAAVPTSISTTQANGIISNTNLNSVTLNYNNTSISSLLFKVGERVDMVGYNNIVQGANGIVSYCNTTAIILSTIQGTFATGPNNFILGVSSLQKANIISSISFPNITLSSPQGGFISGQEIFIKTLPDLSVVGNASLIASYKIPNELTEYVISPAVNITGDGTGALAYSVVNTTFLSANEISSVVMLNPGSNYTYANISFSSNNLFGNGAAANPIISPLSGHGSNAYKELGARYAGISMTVDIGENEGYKFPVYGKYRRIGIIENPLFADASIHVANYDRINLSIRNRSGTGFVSGEFVTQANSSAAGIIVTANSTFMQLKNIQGNFVQNSAGDNIVGLTSNTTANVYIANTIQFIASNVDIVSETSTNASAFVLQANSVVLKLTNVSGRFNTNDTVYDSVINAYANVTAIYTVNNTIDSSSNFGLKFSQVARITLSSNTGPYLFGETVTQSVTNASGVIISANTDIDIAFINSNGVFNIGNQITDNTSGATAVVTFANTSYLRLTSSTGTFSTAHRIINNLNIGADISHVYPVLVLNNVNGSNKFQTSANTIIGNQSGSIGKSELTTIIYPELVRDSGSVVYLENIAPVTRTSTSKENINLIIKF
jgi:hypothetical protein